MVVSSISAILSPQLVKRDSLRISAPQMEKCTQSSWQLFEPSRSAMLTSRTSNDFPSALLPGQDVDCSAKTFFAGRER
jgi:hypothetical protein